MGNGIRGHSTLNTQEDAQFNNHSEEFYSFIYVHHSMQLRFMWVFFIYLFMYFIASYPILLMYIYVFDFFFPEIFHPLLCARARPSDSFKYYCRQLSGSLIFHCLTLFT